MHEPGWAARPTGSVRLYGGWCAFGPQKRRRADVEIVEGRVFDIVEERGVRGSAGTESPSIDLSGFLMMPGLVNAHDHLQFGLFPRLGDPPYGNYIEWGTDIHVKFREVIARHKAVPKEVRLAWGGIRNLLCGVTTVCHHDPLWEELGREDFPVRVLQKFGWGHSVALGVDLVKARAETADGEPFIVHACEGVDGQAYAELAELERMGLLRERTVLVHGLSMDEAGVGRVKESGVSLIVCPSSNEFLYARLPDMAMLGTIEDVALGNDSPLTATGDLLDEIRFVSHCCGVEDDLLYRMVTEAPAAVLRLRDGEGSMQASGIGDLIAVRDTGEVGARRLRCMSMHDVELVVVGGCVQLASEEMMERIPKSAVRKMEPLWIEGTIRWLRAPVAMLLRKAEEVLGKGEVRLGGRQVRIPELG